MATLQVLCPNGRRQNVKITPNSKLLQVLDEVCQKQGFLPPEDYYLIHGRKTLDLTLAFRYCNLPNNAKLELIKAKSSREEEDVLIALQLEDGSRHQASFKPSVSLWSILLHWENQPNGTMKGKLTEIDSIEMLVKHPVCIYMREEVIGESALKNTTLRNLALTGGKAVIRLVHTAIDDTTLAKVMQDIESSNAKKAKLEEIASKKLIEQEMEQSATFSRDSKCNDANSSSFNNQPEPMETDTPSSTDLSSSSNLVSSQNDQRNTVDSVVSSSDNGSESVVISGSSRGYQSVDRNTDNSINWLREMNIPGVEIYTPQDFADLTPEEQVIARRLAQRFAPGLMRSGQAHNPVQSTLQLSSHKPQPNFTEFKFLEETKGKEVYNNEFSDVRREEFKPCERESLLYSLEEALLSTKSTNQDVSDDFFEVNVNDLRIMMADLKKNVESMDNQALMTKAMRHAALEAKYEKYERVVIRIQFPNKLVLQALFRPRETVFAIKKYVKENLEDKNMPFYLYTTPPKTILKDNSQTLLEANLVPASLIYFGTELQHETYIKLELISSILPRIKAEEVASKWLKSESATGSTAAETSQLSQPSTSSQSSSRGQEQKVPKWLKLGKK